MKSEPVTVQAAIDLLNEASQLDPLAMRSLVEYHVPCDYTLADHPTVQVDCTENGDPIVGMLGIINGLFGVDENAQGKITGVWDPNDPGAPVTFILNPEFEGNTDDPGQASPTAAS